MTHLLNPATGKYLLNPAPEFLHQEVTSWLSELSFFEIEIEFLSRLLDAAYLRITAKNKINELKELEGRIVEFKTITLGQLRKALMQHEHELSKMDLDLFKTKKANIEEDHRDLHGKVETLIEHIKKIKKEIFDVVEKQLKQSKKIKSGFEEGTLSL